MTVADLRERLAGVPDHYSVMVEHYMFDDHGEPKSCQCRAGLVDIEPVRFGQHRVLALVITAQDCP